MATTKAPISFVTSNKKKLEEFFDICGGSFPREVVTRSIDLLEFQGEPQEIAIEKCKVAAKINKGPVIIEDTSLCFNALGGLPGPYIKWFLNNLGPEGLARILEDFEDKSGYALCIIAYPGGDGEEVEIFEGKAEGKIVKPRGEMGFGWDLIFEPQGFTETYAEMEAGMKNTLSHRRRAIDKLMEYFSVK